MVHLPAFIVSAIEAKNTSLGDNPIFGDNTIATTARLLGERFNDTMKSVESEIGHIPTTDEAKTLLSRLVKKAMELEKPLRPQLEKLCEATVTNTLSVPQETVILTCELVEEIVPYMELRILPEPMDDDFQYTEPFTQDEARKEIFKRRVVDCMIQGISHLLMKATYDTDRLSEWSKELPTLYRKIMALNDFLLMNEEDEISDKNPMLGAYVATHLGGSEEKTVIDVQGLTYPFLLQESYRGFFEMFGTHGLPDDARQAMYIIRRSDFTKAEPWDMRLGVEIWKVIDKAIDNEDEANMYPYIFSSLASLGTEEFNNIVNGLIEGKEEAKEWMDNLTGEIRHDIQYNQFKTDIERFNLEKTVVIDGNEGDEKVIEEEEN